MDPSTRRWTRVSRGGYTVNSLLATRNASVVTTMNEPTACRSPCLPPRRSVATSGHAWTSIPIQGRPAQAQRFSPPQPECQHDCQQRLVSRASYLIKKSLCLVNRERSTFVAANARCRREGGRIARNQAFPLRLPQSSTKYCSNDPDSVGAVASTALPGQQLINIGDRQPTQNPFGPTMA
jgi:hypothetical protein